MSETNAPDPATETAPPAETPATASAPPPDPTPPPVAAVVNDDGWSDEESVLSWKLFAGVFVVLAVIGVAAFALFGGGGDKETATGTGAQPSTATGGAALNDTFDRADNAGSLGQATSGQTWESVAGTWGVSGNQGYVAVPNEEGGKRSLAVINLGSGNGSVEATAAKLAAGWGLVFRYQGPYSYWMVVAAPQYGTYNLQKVVDGKVVAATPGGLGFAAVEDGTKVRVEFSGPSITVFVNGNPLKVVQDPALQSGTKVGMVVPATGAAIARWEDFTANVGAATPAPAAAVPGAGAAPAGGAGAGAVPGGAAGGAGGAGG